MKKSFSTLLAAMAVTGILATGQAQAQSAVLDRIKNNGVLRVGVKTDYRPFGYLDPSGSIVGLEPDLAADMARRLDVRLELVPVQTANRIEFLQQGRIDMMIATMSVNEQRRKVVGVIEPFYYAGGTGLLIHKNAGIQRWEDIKDKPVCATQGAYYNRDIAQKYGARIVAFPGNVEAQNALLTGSCIGFLQDSTLLASILAGGETKWADYEMPLPVENVVPWAIAVPLQERDQAYGDFARQAVTDWHASGLLRSLEQKWGLPASEFLTEEQTKAAAQ
ncbi:transporter substrate-binding domain-containing protein [Corticimicrobacter populi]|uniref:ABC transporter substrate-binding protein n=1 Tax=Corticimicrobacter populi TaxID=2175229 RepID=A0A2V1K175_9BURK|nr:transporter substrate-binding domain-containing protein [Corticimicrobacter populi]PWF22526.1 ABC transporter substrate-binding protein [Corticimicrobacter populi]